MIIAYAISNLQGAYRLEIPTNTVSKGLHLSVTAIGFKSEIKNINDTSATYDFVLLTESYRLKTVYIKDNRARLKVAGDTLSYKVADFSTSHDRVIGDVIKKLPGIDVDAQGRISYNGKGISNFYIGGDDLLDDRYNIATSSIPTIAVDKIEVMQNHQPVKMLKGKVVSDDVAINITIKESAKLHMIGQAELGAGTPEKYDANINAMLFKDKFKAINYAKANDVGKNLGDDLIAHNAADVNKRIDNSDPENQLSPGTAGSPDLPSNRYLFNHASLVTLNNLLHLKNDVQVKLNFSYLHDRQQQQYNVFSKTYLNNDTIGFSEKQNNRQSPDLLHLQFNININKDKTYLNEAFAADLSYNSNHSELVTNGNGAAQRLDNRYSKFLNELNYMWTFKNGLIFNFYSHFSHLTKPETLAIDSNLNKVVIHDQDGSPGLVQRLNLPTWATNNYLSFKKVLKVVTLKYRMGFNTQAQLLESSLHTVSTSSGKETAIDSASNQLRWYRSKLYSDAGFDIPGDRFALSLNLPVILQQTGYSEDNFALKQKLTDLYFNPQIKFLYKAGQENDLEFDYALNNYIGNAEDVARGYILKNYRTLDANDAGLIGRTTQKANFLANFRKSAKMLFFFLNASYAHVSSDAIRQSIINKNYQQNLTLPYENGSNNWVVSASVSKYLFFIHSTVSGGPVWQIATADLLQNGQLISSKTRSNGFNLNFEAKLNRRINFSYKGYIADAKSYIGDAAASSFTQFNQQASIYYVPQERLFFKISGERYYTKQPVLDQVDYAFLDLAAHYGLKNNKIQFDLSATNLLNTKTYSTSYILANTFTSTTYNIPGRILIGKITFNY